MDDTGYRLSRHSISDGEIAKWKMDNFDSVYVRWTSDGGDGIVFPKIVGTSRKPPLAMQRLAEDKILPNQVFVGIFPGGISYADTSKEEGGDYKRLAFLSYRTLELEIRESCPSDLAEAIRSHAAVYQENPGAALEVSGCHQLVRIGESLLFGKARDSGMKV